MSTNFRWNTPSIPIATKNIIIINSILWLATLLLGQRGIVDLNKYLALHFWLAEDFHIHQFVTYMFMHDSSGFSTGIWHILFNMFTLWMFGSLLERVMGVKRFLIFYFVCGIGAGIVQEVVWHLTIGDLSAYTGVNTGSEIIPVNQFYNLLMTVGASGAVFGILLAFAVLFPNIPIYIMLIPIPVKAKWAVIGFALFELFFGVAGINSSVAHFAHLGGMLFAAILLFYWKKKGVFDRYHEI